MYLRLSKIQNLFQTYRKKSSPNSPQIYPRIHPNLSYINRKNTQFILKPTEEIRPNLTQRPSPTPNLKLPVIAELWL